MIRKSTYNSLVTSGKRLAFLLPVLLLSACASEDMAENRESGNGALAVREVVTETGGTTTRAATAPPTGSSIGVFRQTDSYYTTASNNVKYTLATDGKWKVATTGTDILLGANDSRALLYAYSVSYTHLTLPTKLEV